MEMGLSEGRKGQGRGKGGKGARGGRKGRAGGRKGEGGRGETGGKGWKVENGGGGKFDQGYYRWKLAGNLKQVACVFWSHPQLGDEGQVSDINMRRIF